MLIQVILNLKLIHTGGSVNSELKELIETRENSYKEMQGYLKELGYYE